MTSSILFIVSFLLDGILTNFLSYLPNQSTYFLPLFTLVCVPVLYPFYRKNHQKYFITVAVSGFLYDLFYTNLFFLHTILFMAIAYVISLIYHRIRINALTNIIMIVIVIASYESIYAFLLFVFNVVPIYVGDVCYQIVHSLFLNVVYGEIMYLVYKLKNRKRRLN